MTLEELLALINYQKKRLGLPGEFFIEAAELIWMYPYKGNDEDVPWGAYSKTINAIDEMVSDGKFEATEPWETPESIGFRIKKK